ncbi:MAG: enoyl-CoA hydratase-related protein [Anaerolineales bacterium]
MTYTSILTETREGVGLVTFNRPQALNALNFVLMTELIDALTAFDADDAVGAMVITGSERVFAAGADITEMAEALLADMLTGGYIELFDAIRRIKKPLIAAVSGFALGGGCELALSCDMIIASDAAKFGQPEINLGVIPGAGGTQRLARAIGKALAMEMALNNRTLTAAEACQFGLVNHVLPVDHYLEFALSLAAEIASRAPLAVRLAKEAVNGAFEGPLSEGLVNERRSFYMLFATDDKKEGMQAFLEKRKPHWKGK